MSAILMWALALQSAPIGSRIPRDEWANATQEEGTEVRRIAEKFGDCVVAKHPEAAREMVLIKRSIKDGDRQGRALVGKVADGNCLLKASESFANVRMTFPGDNMRYALADALFRRELKGAPSLGDLKQVDPLDHPVLDEAEYRPKNGKPPKPREAARFAEDRAKEEARIALSRFGECVVRANPQAALALLQTSVVTAQESAAFGGIRPALATCVPAGQTIKLDKALVRGTIAYNYYRLARAPRSLPTPSPAGAK